MKHLAVSFFILPFLVSCALPTSGDSFIFTTYNAYAFFDGIDDGTEYDGFRRHDGYDGEAYSARIRDMAILLGRVASSSDVIMLQEIESIEVLADLLEAGLLSKGFRYYCLAPSEEGLSVGFVSRIEPFAVSVHSCGEGRPILEAAFMKGGRQVRLFGVHFRSRIDGGEEERAEQARHLRTLMDERGGIVSIALGDFNTDPRYPEESMAIYPDDHSPENALHVVPDPSLARSGVYYSPVIDEDVVLGEKGTYWHQGGWYLYDNILMTEEAWDGQDWEFEDAWIPSSLEMKDRLGRPLAYDPSLGYGYSDHFPLTAELRLI